jgi:tetratricopeptide (TPR) repeat protein
MNCGVFTVDDTKNSTRRSLLEQASGTLERGDIQGALELFKQLLEDDPDDENAREGFRLAYAVMLEGKESIVIPEESVQRKHAALIQLLEYLEAMLKVVRRDRIRHSSPGS